VTERAIGEALKFVDEVMGWSRRLLLPSANAVIVLAAAMDRANLRFTSKEEELFKRWLCLTALRGVFQGSVETTINRFLRAIKDRRRSPAVALINSLRRDEKRPIRPDEFMWPSHLWGPATQVMHAWLVSQDARDWIDADRAINTLAREGGLDPGGDLTVHHIFARDVLKDFLEDSDLANRPANFGLVSRSTNSEFGSKRPDEVLAVLTPAQRKSARAQFFGTEAGDRLHAENYDDFCQWRAKCLAEALNLYLGIK
jgi:hypothetical protein